MYNIKKEKGILYNLYYSIMLIINRYKKILKNL